MAALEINRYYNFSVYANSILGTSYRGAKLICVLDYRTALKFGNVQLRHRQVFPYLPPGTPSDPTKYTYYLFSYNGVETVLANVWILDESVEETSGMNFTLKLNNISDRQLSIVRDQLRLLGISFDIL